ncbi:isochorismate synthase [Croceibacterium xixiisoli]|nr:isochorismate synthase [Croceibacterium xixiisoli]
MMRDYASGEANANSLDAHGFASGSIDVVSDPLPVPATPTADAALPWVFALSAVERRLFATGLQRRLTAGPAATLGDRVRAFFAALPADSQAPQVLVGALPFDRTADDLFFQPQSLSATPWNVAGQWRADDRHWRVRGEPDRNGYQAAVTKALATLAQARETAAPGESVMTKLVLSRSLLLAADQPIDPLALSVRLTGDPGAVRFITPTLKSQAHPQTDADIRHLVGATPELLLHKQGAQILSHPLAGSSRRSADPRADHAAADALLHSRKDHREHGWVVEAILDGLAPFCSTLSAPREPELVSTETMWHLGTRIAGTLRHPDDTNAAELAAVLHPTPAVGGTPRDTAVKLIGELEGYDRGFYAGAVGWTDASGDGAFYVSLRCAEIHGQTARVYAGAGIVEGSDPVAEAEETSAKLQAVLRALGVDETGRPID